MSSNLPTLFEDSDLSGLTDSPTGGQPGKHASGVLFVGAGFVAPWLGLTGGRLLREGTVPDNSSPILTIQQKSVGQYPYAMIDIDHWATGGGDQGGSIVRFTNNGIVKGAVICDGLDSPGLEDEYITIVASGPTSKIRHRIGSTDVLVIDASGAYVNGVGLQPLDADLTAIAALTTTNFGRSLLTQADAAATRTTIGAQASLGFTPVNKAGDTMTGSLTAASIISGGNITPTTPNVGSLGQAASRFNVAYFNWMDVSNDASVGTNASFVWTGRSRIYSSADGQVSLRNNANNANASLSCNDIGMSGGFSSAPRPTSNNSIDLGVSGYAWRDVYIGRNAFVGNEIGAGGIIVAGVNTGFGINGQTKLRTTTAGVLNLLNWAEDGFTRLNFGPATSSFASLAASGSTLSLRRGDGNGWGDLQVGSIVNFGVTSLSGPLYYAPVTFATLPSASAQTGARYRITDRAQRACYSDGTNWRFVADDAIVT